jgi:hypothetical protein
LLLAVDGGCYLAIIVAIVAIGWPIMLLWLLLLAIDG